MLAWQASVRSFPALSNSAIRSTNPLASKAAVMAARIASGHMLEPEILLKKRNGAPKRLPFPDDHLQVVRDGMDLVVNGAGTAVRSRLELPDVTMGGKTGTAQVRAIKGGQRGQGGARRFRDHGLFVCFAPVAQPRYAAAVVIEHGMGGARAAAPVAKDVLTFLYDREKIGRAHV
jgi:penicillin-binding protein 2